MLGRWMSDLEKGDRLGPIEREITPFMIREYAHSVEDGAARHQGVEGLVAPPTLLHAHKKRLLEDACPEGVGPHARMHLQYDATHHAVIPSGTVVTISGEVTDRYERRGRERVLIQFEIRDALTGLLYTSYSDTSLVSYGTTEAS
jgi:hypothetical protein